MASELELPRPLDGEEIKIAIAHKIAEAVMSSLDKRCQLYGKAYPKFRATFAVEYTLDDFGRTFEGAVGGDTGSVAFFEDLRQYAPAEGAVEGETVKVEGEIPETPPNQLRRETAQSVPVQVTNERGQQAEKAVVYQPKGKRGGPRIGRAAIR